MQLMMVRVWDLSRFKKAADIFQNACTTHPDSYEAHYWLGAARFHIILHRLGDETKPVASNRFLLKDLKCAS